MVNGILVEVCCGGIDDCLTAVECGCDRIELNSALELGGLTPSLAVLQEIKQKKNDIKVCCMVRPRGDGFCYSKQEFEIMKNDACILLENGADGIVFGFLNPDRTINKQWTKEMVALIHPKEAVFHKAFDNTSNHFEAIEDLIDCGIDRVLTSGGANYPHVEEGFGVLHRLIQDYGSQIQILPGGGVREHNVQEIIKQTGCSQIHMTAKEIKTDPSSKGSDNNGYVTVSKNNLLAIMRQIEELKK